MTEYFDNEKIKYDVKDVNLNDNKIPYKVKEPENLDDIKPEQIKIKDPSFEPLPAPGKKVDDFKVTGDVCDNECETDCKVTTEYIYIDESGRGKDGLSAYELALREGFVGTLEEYLRMIESTYTSEIPTPTTIGGIQAGSTFDKVSFSEMMDRLLYPYIGPSAGISSSLPLVLEKGTTYDIGITVRGSSKSKPLQSIDLYKDSTFINSQPKEFTGWFAIDKTTSFSSRASDGQGEAWASLTVHIVNPVYIGPTSKSLNVLTANDIKSLRKIVTLKGNTQEFYHCDNQYMTACFPVDWVIKEILDQNNFSLLKAFTTRPIMIDGNSYMLFTSALPISNPKYKVTYYV